jgi:hypothetical protein
MNVKIEDYRGFEMSFNPDDEVFYCMSSSYDTETTKKSYAALKKWVDDYIKDNQIFRPITIMRLGLGYDNEKVTLVGYRKDGRFVYKNDKDKLEQLSEYDENRWYMPNDLNTPIIEKIIALEAEKQAIVDKIIALDKELIKVDFKSVRTQYIPQ